MSPNTFDVGSIGPDLNANDVVLPPHVGERFATLLGRDERIETVAEWIAATRVATGDALEDPPSEDDLCHASDGPHSVAVEGERSSFVCVLDPLVVPFLREQPGVVRSETPIENERVTVAVERDAATIEPEGAVVSLGVSRDVEADEPVTPERVYRAVCPYVHAFTSPEAYERWADDVDASTTSVPAETGVAIAREIANELFA